MSLIKELKAFFKIETKNTLAYRGQMSLWILGWFISFIIMIFLWQSAETHGLAAGFTKEKIITYYFVGVLVMAVCGWFPFEWVVKLIKNGEIVSFLTRPINFHNYCFAAETAWHTVNTGVFVIFFSMIFLFIKDFLFLDFDFMRLLFFILAIIIACLICFESNMVLSTAAFWLIHARNLGSLYWLVFSLFGGQLLPIKFFPEGLQPIIEFLPFRFMYSFPIEIYLNQLSQKQLLVSFVVGIFWVLFFKTLFNFFWKKGLKIYTAFGN